MRILILGQANLFSFPLKSQEHPHGIYTEHELYMILAILFVGMFFDIDPSKSFPLRQVRLNLPGLSRIDLPRTAN